MDTQLRTFGPPLSFEDLNQRLTSCQPEGNFQVLELPTLNSTEIKLQNFLASIRFPIQSYPDLNKQTLGCFLKHVFRLFPMQTEEDKKCFQEFFKRINPDTSNAISKPEPDFMESIQSLTNQIKKTDSGFVGVSQEQLFQQPLSVIIAFILHPYAIENPEDRLDRLLNLFLSKKLNEIQLDKPTADLFQKMLSLLHLEDQLFKSFIPWVEKGLECCKVKKLHEEGNQVIKLSPSRQIVVFKMHDEQMEMNSEEWAFKLQYERFLQNIQLEFASYKETIRHLNCLLKNFSHSPLKNKIIQLIYFIEFKQMRESFKQLEANFTSELVKGITINTLEEEANELAPNIVPFFVTMFNHFTRRHEALNLESPNGQPEFGYEDLVDNQSIYHSWLFIRNQQKQFYYLAWQRFSDLIKLAPKKNKIQWISYTKNLAFVPQNSKPQEAFNPNFYDKPILVNGNIYPSKSYYGIPEEVNQDLEAPPATPVIKVPSIQPDQEIKKKKSNRNRPNKHREKNQNNDKESSEKPTVSPSTTLDTLTTKSHIPGKEFCYLYDQRVTRWMKHPYKTALPIEIFGDYGTLSLENQQWKHLCHGFSSLVDRFLEMGLKSTWDNPTTKNKDCMYIIPAELEQPGTSMQRGVIVYAIDEKGICYHRYFHQLNEHLVVEKIIKETFYYNDFPEISHTNKTNQKPEKFIQPQSNETLEIDRLLGQVTIFNPLERVKLKLFRVKPFISEAT